jgi:hypothetical protein
MNFLYKIYFFLPNFAQIGILGKIINRILAMVLKRIFDFFVPSYFMKTNQLAGLGINITPRKKKVIISLTSFPARINDVWITIECVLRQSYKPDMVILWLAESQFTDKNLPESLIKLKDRGLTINFCNDDLRSHKKYIYALEQYPNDYIVTLDDDLYYDKDLLKNILIIKEKFPNSIATNRAHKITFKKNKIQPYRKWHHNSVDITPSHSLVQTGGFGTIYQKSDLFKDFNNKELIKELAFHADDLWLKIMVFLNNKKVVTNSKYNKDPITVKTSQIEKLVTTNVIEGGNDKQMLKMLNYYKIQPSLFRN